MKFKKVLLILLAVLFLVSVTAAVASAPHCSGPKPHCHHGAHVVCVRGHWVCEGGGPAQFCSGPKPHCPHGAHYVVCEHGKWRCMR